MEVEKKQEMNEEIVKNGDGLKKPEQIYKWIRNEALGNKTCEACGAIMRGWAYREVFNYCPKCGNRVV